MARCVLLIMFTLTSTITRSQFCSDLTFKEISRIDLLCGDLAMTMIPDNRELPYLYVANKSEGLTIYDISDLSSPELIGEVIPEALDFLHVMNLVQRGNYLFLRQTSFNAQLKDRQC